MDEQPNPILESLKSHVATMEATGVARDEITAGLMALIIERCQPSVQQLPDELVFDPTEVMLLTVGGQLAKKRKVLNDAPPELALLSFAAERCLQLMGRQKLRSHFECLSAELTCPSDFWQ